MSTPRKKPRGFIVYPNYHFKAQMPAIGHVLAEVRAVKADDKDIKATSGVSPSTLSAWRTRRTREARHSTLVRVLRAIGKDYGIIDWNGRK